MDDLSNEEVDSLSKAMDGVAVEDAQPKEDTPRPAVEPEKTTGSIPQAQFMQLEEVAQAANLPPQDLQKMADIKVDVEVILGNTKMPLESILQLQPGSVIELDKLAGEPVELIANDKLLAHAEVVIVEDTFGVKILDINV